SGVFLVLGADEGELFGAGDIAFVRTMEIAAGLFLRAERNQASGLYGQRRKPPPLVFRPVAHDDVVGFGELRDTRDPLLKSGVCDLIAVQLQRHRVYSAAVLVSSTIENVLQKPGANE